MEAGEASGFAFAEKELTKKQKKGLGKLMKSKDEVDLRPSLVSAAVRAGGEEAKRVLKSGFAAVENGSWLQTWIAVGLLELGDTSQIQLAKAALGNPEWAFTTVRIATALAKNGDYSGVPALATLYENAAKGVAPDTGKAVLAFLAGEGAQYQNDKASQKARLIRLRQQVASALANIDRPECVPQMVSMLTDSEASVRMATAYALARMGVSEAASGLNEVMNTDFGMSNNRSRNPAVHALAVRRAAARFADDQAGAAAVTSGASSTFASVKFLSLCVALEKGPEPSTEAEPGG
jgi:HEAT repeat protein